MKTEQRNKNLKLCNKVMKEINFKFKKIMIYNK